MKTGIIVILATFLFISASAFPANFSWGASTSAYQIEGAWNISGKGLDWWDYWNLWNNFTVNETGDVADLFYYRFEEDIKLMKTIGLQNFRMSIDWTRIMPNGTTDNINPSGVSYYNAIFDGLQAAGIEPWVTLFHGNFPQSLNWPNATGSFLNENISFVFADYADFCFKNFGDRVKHWITLNEPQISSWFGYGSASGMPMRCSPKYSDVCAEIGGGGNSSTEPYIAARNFILSHARSVQVYREKYQASQGGKIGWTLNINYFLPYNASNPEDQAGVETILQFFAGWFAGPVILGDYPQVMKDLVGDRLPAWTAEEQQLINGTLDFFGVNHYTTWFAEYVGGQGTDWGSDSQVNQSYVDVNNQTLGIVSQSGWLFNYPPGFRMLLNWIKVTYGDIPIVVLENGWDTLNESYWPVEKAVADYQRINVINGYIDEMVAAIEEDNVNVIGYFVWAWMDNFEWGSFIPRFGLVYVDYNQNLTRIPKASAYWYIEKQKGITEWALGLGEYPYYDFDEYLQEIAY